MGKLREILSLFLFIIGNILAVYFSTEYVFKDLFYFLVFYIVGVAFIFVSLYYIEKYYNLSLILGTLFSFLMIIENINNYIAYFFLVFYFFLFLLKKQYCIDKFSSKLNISKSISLILSAILFFIFMQPSSLEEGYVKILENSKLNKIITESTLLFLNSSYYQNVLKEEIEKQKEELIKEYQKEKRKIEELNIPEEEKKVLLKKLEKNLNESLKEFNLTINSKLTEILNTSLESTKSLIKNIIKDEFNFKLMVIFVITPIIGLINIVTFYLSLILILLLDFVFSFFKKEE